jgi:hypothetical protein
MKELHCTLHTVILTRECFNHEIAILTLQNTAALKCVYFLNTASVSPVGVAMAVCLMICIHETSLSAVPKIQLAKIGAL